MNPNDLPFDRIPSAGMDPASFSQLLDAQAFDPAGQETAPAEGAGRGKQFPQATTILALRHAGGVVIAGDRRATEGYSIAHRSIEKVFPTDDWSAVAIAGTAGPAIEMTRLFQTELEHYEKIEGERLSLEGQANKLSQMIRTNLSMAMQGLAVVPLFAGFDLNQGIGRIFKYDVTGGRYEESDFWATGSGGRDARATIKKRYRPEISQDEAVKVALEALFDASEEDVGTGGPDVLRNIYPNIASITADGFREIPHDEIARLFESLLQERKEAGAARSEERIPGSSEHPMD